MNMQLCGCFTYTEVETLVEKYGAIEEHGTTWYDWSKDKLSKGIGGSTWFYFHFKDQKSFNEDYVRKYVSDKIR